MKLRDDDKVWLSNELAKQVDISLAVALDTLKPHGFRRVTFWLKEWGAISALWAVPLALLAAVITLGVVVVNRAISNASFETKTTSDIEHITKDVTDIKKGLIAQQLIGQSSVSQPAFAASLPDLGKSLASVREQKASIPKSIIAEMQEKLIATNPTTPGYWPTAGELISFRSQLSGDIEQASLPNCLGQPIQFTVASGTRTTFTPAPGSMTIKHCQLKLDSPEGAEVLSNGLSTGGLNLEDCLIFYGGGAVPLHPVKFDEKSPRVNPSGSVRFINCLFVVSLKSAPAPEGQRLTKELLTSNGVNVKFDPNS